MTRARLAILLTTAVVTAVLAMGARRAPTAGGVDGPGMATVVKVVDGDTINVRLGSHTEAVRLIGIDTPESVKPNSPVECFAREASARTKELVPPGSAVRLVRDVEARDRYGRLLAYVYRPSDGLFVNLALARDGFAAPLTIPPNRAYAADFAAAAADARRARRGLWSACGGPHEAAADERGPPGHAGAADDAGGRARASGAAGAIGAVSGAPP